MNELSAIFFDVDQTLYDGTLGKIPDSAVTAIQAVQRNGIKVFIATGRPFCSLADSHLDDLIHWDGYICSNGAVMQDANGSILEEFAFSEVQRTQLFALCKQYNMSLSIQTAERIFAPLGVDENMIKAYGFFHNPAPAYDEYRNDNITMAVVYQSDDFDYSVVDTIEGLSAIKGKSNYADVVMNDINKGFGIRRMQKLLHLDGKLMAFGDADNDLEMITSADIGIAMGNATDLLKEKAVYVTDTIHHDGVFLALKHYGLF